MKQNQSPGSKISSYLILLVIANTLVSLTLGVLYFTGSSKQNRIVYVDAIKLISKYKGMEDAQKNFRGKNDAFKANLDTLQKELEQASTKYNATKQKASTSDKLFMEGIIKSKQKQFLEYEQFVKEQYQKQEQELSADILKKVNAYVKKFGEQKGYEVILAATHYGNIAYGDKALDITDIVLKGLNEEYKTTPAFK